MSVGFYLAQEAKNVFNTYRPIYTEASGIRDVTLGLDCLAHSSLWRLRGVDDDLRTGISVSAQAMQISATLIAQGAIKLAIPIIMSTGYAVSRIYF